MHYSDFWKIHLKIDDWFSNTCLVEELMTPSAGHIGQSWTNKQQNPVIWINLKLMDLIRRSWIYCRLRLQFFFDTLACSGLCFLLFIHSDTQIQIIALKSHWFGCSAGQYWLKLIFKFLGNFFNLFIKVI